VSLLVIDTSAIVAFAERWVAVASGIRVLDRLDLAVALLEASTRRGFLLTGEPDAYGDPGADYVIPI
jgi:hypothetical protein